MMFARELSHIPQMFRHTCIAMCLLLLCFNVSGKVQEGQCAAPVTQNATTDPMTLLLRFRDNTANLHTLQADFQQEKHLALLTETLASSGRLCAQQTPEGKSLLWEYTSPSVSGFVYDSGNVRVWMRERTSIRAANDKEAQAIGTMSAHVLTWVRADPDKLAKHYHLEYLPAEPAEKEAPLPSGIRLVPRRSNSFFSAIDVRFSETLDSLHSLRLVEPHGDTTVLRFTSVVSNEPPSPFCVP